MICKAKYIVALYRQVIQATPLYIHDPTITTVTLILGQFGDNSINHSSSFIISGMDCHREVIDRLAGDIEALRTADVGRSVRDRKASLSHTMRTRHSTLDVGSTGPNELHDMMRGVQRIEGP